MKFDIPKIAVCALVLIFVAGCSDQAKQSEERWIGHYQFVDSDIEFPIFMEMTLDGKSVRGRSVGHSSIALIKGTIVDRRYELLLQPVSQGDSRNQDVFFRGNRNGKLIVGEWEHVIGVTGPWVAELTDLNVQDALGLYRGPCDEEQEPNSDGLEYET